ncbi:MAG: hypothetical protein IKY83_01885 [Proteobacteria bacterium]|nr:hypothetical protein [Pseudomonadota bacterium]
MSKNKVISSFESKMYKKKLWKRSFFYIIGILMLGILAGLLILGLNMAYFYHYKKFPPPPDLSGIQPYLKNGDIILRSGIGFWSESFRQSNTKDKRFSHVGIVLVDEHGTVSVLHSEGDDHTGNGKVAIVSLEKFVGDSVDIGISRLRDADPNQFAAEAKKYLGRPFDWKFDTDSSSEVYCTELVELAMKSIYPERSLSRNSQNIILPEACLDRRFFTEIILSDNAPKTEP